MNIFNKQIGYILIALLLGALPSVAQAPEEIAKGVGEALNTAIRASERAVGQGTRAAEQSAYLMTSHANETITIPLLQIDKNVKFEGSLYPYTSDYIWRTYKDVQTGKFGTSQTHDISTNPETRRIDLLQQTQETRVLEMHAKEQKLFHTLTQDGIALYTEAMQSLDPHYVTPQSIEWVQSHVDKLPDYSLREVLTNSLIRGDQETFLKDVSDYYALEGDVIDCAISYLTRNPHKMTMWLNNMMYNPLVTPTFRKLFRNFLSASTISANQSPILRSLLEKIRDSYQIRISIAQDQQIIKDRHDFLQDTIKKTTEFIERNGRRPSRNTLDPEEQILVLDVEWGLIVMPGYTNFEPLISDLKQLQTLWEANEPVLWEYEKMMEELEKFYVQHHTLPGPYTQGGNVSAQEAELYDQWMGWALRDSKTTYDTTLMQHKYKVAD